jgi:hypothetical protein
MDCGGDILTTNIADDGRTLGNDFIALKNSQRIQDGGATRDVNQLIRAVMKSDKTKRPLPSAPGAMSRASPGGRQGK